MVTVNGIDMTAQYAARRADYNVRHGRGFNIPSIPNMSGRDIQDWFANRRAGSGAAGGGGTDEFNASGAASIKNILVQYGLDELVPLVDGWVRQGLSWAEIEVQLRDPSTAAGKVFDRLIPEVRLRREAGLTPMSVAQIIGYRQNAREVLRAAGLPEGFYDSPEDMRDLIVNDVSLQELQNRVREFEDFGAQIAAGAGGELDLFERAYGVKPTAAQLAALVLDPDKALPGLKRQFAAVRLDVSAGRAGFGDLSQGEAERLADVGVDPGQAVAGFGVLADSKELFGALPGQEGSEDTIGRSDQLGAVFAGDARSRGRIEAQARRRKAQFEGGGGFASDNSGFAGIGTAR